MTTVSSPRDALGTEAAAKAPSRFFDLELLDNRYPALHGMRVFAILSVIQYHVTMNFTFARALPIDPGWGATSMSIFFFGMDLFFVLSGFLIGSILLHSVESSGSAEVRRFYLRRAFRTFPPYYFVLTFLALATPLTVPQRHHLWMEFVYLTNYGLPLVPGQLVMPWGWSLALEEQFYFAVPLLFLALYRFRGDASRLAILGALWLIPLAVRVVACVRHPGWDETSIYDALYYRTHSRFDTLIAGVTLAYVQRRWRAPIARWLQSPAARAALALPGVTCLWLLMNPLMFGQRALALVHAVSWGTLTSLMYFAWTLLILNGGAGWMQRVLSLPVFRRIATLGYGVYLVHLPLCEYFVSHVAQSLVERHGWPMVAVWPGAVATLFGLSLAISYFLHIAIEKPSLRLRDRLAV